MFSLRRLSHWLKTCRRPTFDKFFFLSECLLFLQAKVWANITMPLYTLHLIYTTQISQLRYILMQYASSWNHTSYGKLWEIIRHTREQIEHTHIPSIQEFESTSMEVLQLFCRKCRSIKSHVDEFHKRSELVSWYISPLHFCYCREKSIFHMSNATLPRE